MKRRQFLPGVGHTSRAIFFMLAALVGYGAWLSILTGTGLVDNGTSTPVFAALLLAPLLPIAIFDLWLRITWEPELPTLYPPPPSLFERLLQREYGLYWFPVMISLPLWVWATGLYGVVIFSWLKDF